MWQGSFKIGFSLLLLTCLPLSRSSNITCKKQDQFLAQLNMAMESIAKVKEYYPDYTVHQEDSSQPVCGTRETLFSYLDVAEDLISNCLQMYSKYDHKEEKYKYPMDCSEVLENGHSVSGIYSIWINDGSSNKSSLPVFCDMDTSGGGWTVIQRRGDFPEQEDFFRDWDSYKKGFGNIAKDFWLGNDNIFALTNQAPYAVRFDLEDANGTRGYAEYRHFKIGDESLQYVLYISNYSGNVGDAMMYHNHRQFSTKDTTNDESTTGACALSWKGGWWYKSCYKANINGVYNKGAKSDSSTITWVPWRNYDSLTSTEIKLKRI